MQTLLDLPDDLVHEVKQRALCEGRGLNETVARFLRQGMDRESVAVAPSDELVLARRREMTKKFVTGQCGVALDNFEADRQTDRRKSAERLLAWRN